MYKQSLLIFMFTLLGGVTFGQIGSSPNSNTGSNTATVNIILHDVQSIVVEEQNVIDLVYDTPEKYQNGVSVERVGHLNIFSTGDYNVGAAVWQENLLTQNDIYVNNILMTRQFQSIYQGNAGSRLVDVEYKAKGNNEYLDKTKATYTTQVIYTLIPR